MQPIILLGVAVAAVALVGTGFLAQPWNQFELFVQQLGWGEADLDSPISSATVDLEIKKILSEDGTFYENVISDCSFHSATSIAGVTGPGARDGTIICKILDANNNAFAEGHIAISSYDASTVLFIPIDMCIDSADPTSSTPFCLDVQAEIHAVKVVVEAPIGQN